jgi:hypothetical protein
MNATHPTLHTCQGQAINNEAVDFFNRIGAVPTVAMLQCCFVLFANVPERLDDPKEVCRHT